MVAQTPFRLRFDGREELLGEGDHVIGRAVECELVLDDPMASRRHAVLRVSPERVLLEDMGSRNGLLVNNVRMFEPIELHHGDKIVIGSTEIFLVEAARRRREEMATRPLQTSGVRERGSAPPVVQPAGIGADWESDSTAKGSVYEVLISACDRALLQGQLDDAQAAVRNLLLSVRAAILRKQPIDVHTTKSVAGFALQLAERTGDPTWLDRLFEVMAAGGHVPDPPTIERLGRVVPRLGLGGAEALRGYVARMSERAAELDPHARQRLESLAAVVDRVGT